MENIGQIKRLEKSVEENLKNERSGHDYEHTKRVLKNALGIAQNYPQIDKEVLIVACLLHDIAFKDGFVEEHHKRGAEQAREILNHLDFSKEKIDKVCKAILNHCKNIHKIRNKEDLALEDKILGDADSIDAFGSIGLIRMINFCKDHNFPYFKSKKDELNDSIYGGVKAVISWEKTLFTKEGRRLAKSRMRILKEFLKNLEEELK